MLGCFTYNITQTGFCLRLDHSGTTVSVKEDIYISENQQQTHVQVWLSSDAEFGMLVKSSEL